MCWSKRLGKGATRLRGTATHWARNEVAARDGLVAPRRLAESEPSGHRLAVTIHVCASNRMTSLVSCAARVSSRLTQVSECARFTTASQLDRPQSPGTVQTVRFFAVGSNMDQELLQSWVPSARRLTTASLLGFTLRWNKRSSAGGKLTALRTGHPDDVVWGVVYEVDALGRQHIDEGQRAAGYREERVTVVGPDGDEHDASVYVARAEMLDDSLLPMRSYRDPIVNAARANGLPAEYVDELARTPVADS